MSEHQLNLVKPSTDFRRELSRIVELALAVLKISA